MTGHHANSPDVQQLAAASPFFARFLEQHPGYGEALSKGVTEAFRPDRFAVPAGQDAEAYLQNLRSEVVAHTLVRQVYGHCDLNEVVGTMSLFADAAVSQLLQHHHRRILSARSQGAGADATRKAAWLDDFVVVALGKWGGEELNVSSDIDLVFVYANPDGDEERQWFFTKLAQALIASLSGGQGSGWVFRVDTELRPHGKAGPLVCSLEALQNYFFAEARAWERYAWQKARFITGGEGVKAQLAAIVTPFVYRRYLDFSMISHLRDMHQQVRAEGQRLAQRHSYYGDSVKLGQGGIRQLEFFTQVLQLIRGGRDQALQMNSTRKALAVLAQRGYISTDSAQTLLVAYNFLRQLEHALQWREDAQTHYLPQRPEEGEAVALILGCRDYAAVLATLEQHREVVSRHFETMFATTDVVLDPNPGSTAIAGFEVKATAHWQSLFATPKLRALGEGGQDKVALLCQRVDALLPRFVAGEQDLVVRRFCDLIEAVARRSVYLDLLLESKPVLERLLDLLAASLWASHYLCQHPILLDELIVTSPLAKENFQAYLEEGLAARHNDLEGQLVWLREQHQSQMFGCLLADLSGNLGVTSLSDELSWLADVVVAVVMQLAWDKLPRRHRETPQIGVIAYGKLGSKELAYGSDLDLVFVYDDSAEEAAFHYSKWVQRFCSLMTTPTSAGVLFAVDLALRPNGESGLPIVSLSAFERYLRQEAWTWEHQALTRARACAGAPAVSNAFETLRKDILCLPRDPLKLKGEFVAMRERMRQAQPLLAEGRFDLKHGWGGMIDLEFIVQFWVMAYSQQSPGLTANTGNIALIRAAVELGLVDAATAEDCVEAYRSLRRSQHQLHLQNIVHSHVDNAVIAPYAARLESVKQLWGRIFEG